MTRDQNIVSVVNVYKTPLLKSPVQQKKPLQNHFSNKQQPLVTEEIQQMLIKGAVKKVTQNSSGQGFLRSLFIIGKVDRGNHLRSILKIWTASFSTATSKLSEIFLSITQFALQDSFRRCIFLNFVSRVVKKTYKASMVCQFLLFFVSLFGTCSIVLHKTVAGTQWIIMRNYYAFSDTSWWFLLIGQTIFNV